MKKALLVLASVAMGSSAFAADGFITFFNRGYTATDGTTTMTGTTATSGGIMNVGGTVGAGALGAGKITVGLFKTSDLNTPLATTTLRQTAGFEGVFTDSINATVTGVSPNTAAALTILAWDTARGSYSAAVTANALRGRADFTSLPLGGPNPPNPDVFTPGLTGFTGLTLVPEPSTYALAFSGAGALLMMARRRK